MVGLLVDYYLYELPHIHKGAKPYVNSTLLKQVISKSINKAANN